MAVGAYLSYGWREGGSNRQVNFNDSHLCVISLSLLLCVFFVPSEPPIEASVSESRSAQSHVCLCVLNAQAEKQK